MRLFALMIAIHLAVFLQAQNVNPIIQFGHTGKHVKEIVLSSDGETMATSDGQTILLWDLANGLTFRNILSSGVSPNSIIQLLLGESPHSISFSPDNESIIYKLNHVIVRRNLTTDEVSAFKVEQLADTTNQTTAPSQTAQKVQSGDYYSSISLNHARSLVAVLRGQVVEVRNYRTQTPIVQFDLEKEDQKDSTSFHYSKTFTFSPNGKQLLINSRVYGIPSGEIQFLLPEPEKNLKPTKVAFSPDGKILARGAMLSTDSVFESGSGLSSGFAKMDSLFEVVKPCLIIQNAETGAMLRSIETTSVLSLSFSPDGEKLLTGHADNTIRLWNWRTGEELLRIQKPKIKEERTIFNVMLRPVNAVAFTADGTGIISAGDETDKGVLMIWDAETGEVLRRLGAAIPPLTIEPRKTTRDSLILLDVEETYYQPWQFVKERFEKGLRLMDLRSGEVPRAFTRHDSIQLSRYGTVYLSMKEDEPVCVFETELGEQITTLESSGGHFNKFVIDEFNNLVAGLKNNEILVWQLRTGKLLHRFEGHYEKIMTVCFDSQAKVMASASSDDEIHFWSLETKEPIGHFSPLLEKEKVDVLRETIGFIRGILKQVSKWTPIVTKFKKSPKLQALSPAVNYSDHALGTADDLLGRIPYKGFYKIELSPDGKVAAAWSENRYAIRFFKLTDKAKNGKIKSFRTMRDPMVVLMQKVAFKRFNEQDLEKTATEMEGDSVQVDSEDDVMTAQLIKFFVNQFNLENRSSFSPDFKLFARVGINLKTKKSQLEVEEIVKPKGFFKKRKKVILPESEGFNKGVTFSHDGAMIAASSSRGNIIRLWSTETGEILYTLKGHNGKINFGPRGKTLMSTGQDRRIIIWDITTNQPLYTFIGIKGSNDYIVLLSSGYYTTSRRESKAVAFGVGKKAYPFEQFDLQYNRPDLLLSTIGENILGNEKENPNKVLIQAYQRAYQKRLKNLNFEESDFNKVGHLPKVVVSGIPLASNNKNLSINIEAKDDYVNLNRLNVWVNDVPVFGRLGKDLSSQPSKHFSETITIELSNGQNKIQVSVLNKDGAESLKTTHQIDYTGVPVKTTLHFITLGASVFKNDTMNLQFPAKDLEYVSKFWEEGKSDSYEQIIQYSLVDEDFTLENIAKLKSDLSQTKIDDEVIIYIATHGVLSEKFDYYLATHDIDFITQSRGLSYERFEKLLDSIPARKKLVFIDACHAGEIDTSNLNAVTSDSIPADQTNTPERFRSSNWVTLGEQNSFELMKMLFVDLRRGTGATIISAAGADEYAWEGGNWGKSAFLYGLMRGLENGQADRNQDGVVRVSELQEYLPKMVSRLTNGKQQPTYRMENIGNDWVVW